MGFRRVQVDKGIRQIAPDRWEVQVHVGRDPETGKLRQVSRTTRNGIADARRIRARLVTEVAQGKHGGNTTTLADLLAKWIEHGERLGRSPNTITGYRYKAATISRARKPAQGDLPGLGDVPLTKLTARHIDAWYAAMLAAGTTPATLMHYHRVLSAALHQAERWGWVERNVARLAQPPTVPRKALTIPPPDRVRDLIEVAASSRSPEMATIITIAALTGVRRGELCGLRWSDVDWDESVITVQRSVYQTATGLDTKPPKTHQTRRLMLDEVAMVVLRGRWERATRLARSTEVTLVPEAYVFSNDADGGTPLRPDSLTHAFARLCRQMEDRATRADPPRVELWAYRLHDLRHYTATELFRAGHNPRTVADRLGHADPALTLRVYTHDTEDQARAAAAALGAGLVRSEVHRV